jgi:hypothetical protein
MDLFYGKYVVDSSSASPFGASKKPVRYYIIFWSLLLSCIILVLAYWAPLDHCFALDQISFTFVLLWFIMSLKYLLDYAHDFVNMPLLANESLNEDGQPISYDQFRLHAI